MNKKKLYRAKGLDEDAYFIMRGDTVIWPDEIAALLNTQHERLERARELLNHLLDSDGARGTWDAIEYAKAKEQAETFLKELVAADGE